MTYELLPEISIKYKKNAKIVQKQIKGTDDAVELLRKMYDADTLEYCESCIVIYLNRANKTIGWMKVSQGGITGTVIDARIIVGVALKCGATGIIVSHNHPSGALTTSSADDDITRKLKEGCRFLDINLLDHIIITAESHHSYAETNQI